MRLKQFMFAFVAMLSFTFSALAQTTVTTEAELKTAMSSGGAVVLGADIELKEAVVIPKKVAIVLDLNGYSIEGVTTGRNGITLEANASLTINDSKGTGVITAKSYVLNGAGGSKIILNAGKIYRSSWAVYTTGSFTINGGTVECNEGSMAIRVAGSGVITLNAGTVTSVQISGGTLNVQNDNATITSGIQLDKGAKDVNITAGTVNGNVTVAPEAQDKLTVSGGTFENPDAVKDYLPSGSALLEKPDGTFEVVAGQFQINETGKFYATLAEAAAAAQTGQTITLLADATEDVTLPAGITFNGNGKRVGNLKAGGDITFTGVTKAVSFSVQNTNTTVNIVDGACLEITGTGRMVIGHGCTFNITGSIENAKTADVAALTPSLIMPGASFTGAGVTFNVTNAYISAPSSYCSSSKSASGTFDFNFTNSIWESADKLAFEAQSTAATVNFDLVNSVLNTGSHLVFAVSRGEVVIDNSNVNVGSSRQIENRSTMTIKNGSVVNGAVATSSNAINPGTIIVENATYAVTGEFSGAAEGTGTLVIKKGANVSVGSIKAGANVTVDAEGMTASDVINFTANLSQFTGTLSVINNDKLEAKIVDGKIVLVNLVAKIGEQGYETLTDALAAAQAGQTITLAADITENVTVSNAVTIDGAGKTYTGAMTIKADATIKNLNFDGKGYNGYAITTRGASYLTIEDCTAKNYGYGFVQLASGTALTTVKNVTVSNMNYGVKVDYSNAVVLENVDINAAVAAVLNSNYGEKTITIKDSELNILGTWVRNNTIKTTYAFEGDNTINEFEHEAALDNFQLAANATLAAPENVITVNAVGEYCAIYKDGKYVSVKATVKAGNAYYIDLQEAIKAAAPNGTVELLSDVTVDKWIMFAEKMTIDDGSLITLNINGLTINGNNKTLTVKSIESAGNGGYLFYDAQNLTVKDLTINIADGLVGGIGLQSGTISNVTFNGGQYGVLPGKNGVTVSGCTFNDTKGYAVYYEDERPGIVVTGNTFNTAEGKYAITMRSNEQFTNNTVVKGRVNLANSATSTVSGNDFGTERFKVYNAAAATITGNTINNLVFNDATTEVKATFADNTLSSEAEAALGASQVYGKAAKINGVYYTTLQAAVNAVKDGETITLVDNVAENVTLTEKVGLYYTIDGAGKTMKGSINVKALSDTEDNRRITIQNISFKDETAAKVDFITSVETNHYPRLTIKSCTFVGSGDATDVAVRLKSSHSVVISECIGTGLHSFLQNTSGWNLTLDRVQVYESKGAFALGTVQGVTIKGSTIDVATYGIRIDANTYNNNAVIESNNVTAFIPVVVRDVNTQSNVTITGENTFTAENTDGKWMVIGKEEYEENGKLPAETAEGDVVVALNGANLTYDGIHGAGLAGKGTAEAPYLINNVAELEIFRNSVNAGSAKYSKPGLCVALNADIDMAGVNWVGIGTATAEHGFMGNFDGKNFKIKNLTINNPTLDSDGYAYAGLFGVTEGTDKDNQNVIKNLTIENVTINTTGDIVSAAIAYPYYTNVDNVKVCGDIKIQGGKYTAGVLAYTRRCVNASNLSIVGNDGSYVKGTQTVGGVISDIQMNGGLTAVYSNFSAEGITVTGEKSVGGIAGIIATQTLNGATVKNVTLDSTDEFAGVVAGRLGGTSTISNVVSENVTGATAVIGATYDGAKAVEARIGDTYYSTLVAAYTAAKAGETVTLLADLTMSEILVIDKAITLDGNGKKLTSTATGENARAINVSGADGVTIKNLTINASGQRAINVIQNATNVTIENVTATAANYTVNLASSAGAAKVAIKNSNLTGLNVVNVAAAGAQVTVEGGKLTCNDQTDAENYAALALNKDGKNATIAATGVTFDIKGDSKKAKNGADGGVITIDGKTDEVDVIVAYISYGNYYNGFTSIEAAIAKAKDGETIGLIRDITASDIITINKSITIDGNGKTITYTGNGTSARAIDVPAAADAELDVTIKNLTVDCNASYCQRGINYNDDGKLSLDGVTVKGVNVTYAVNLPGSADNAEITIKNSNIAGNIALNVWGENSVINAENTVFTAVDNNTKEGYAAVKLNNDGTTSAEGTVINIEGGKIDVTGTAAEDTEAASNGTSTGKINISESTDVNGKIATLVAVIRYADGNSYGFETLEAAIAKAEAGETIVLIRDITASDIITINKSITIDGNGKKLTVNAARGFQITGGTVAISNMTIDMPNAAEGNRGINLYNGDTNAALDVTLNNVTINGGKAYAVNIGGGKDNKLTINGSTLTGYAAINVHTSSVNHTIVVDGSTLNGKNHNNNYSFGTVVVDGTNAHSLTITNTTITTENLEGVTSKYEKVVVGANCTLNWDGGEAAVRSILADSKGGKLYYTDLQTAINDAAEVSGTVQILGNITATESIAIPAAKKVTIDLNGKTITGTDNETKSYGLININPGAELTINDATGNGAIKLTATNNREWNAYSSVISNQRGKLTVNGGTIEHLGGTDMAYAIDNLTNGKGTKAETIINGDTVKSTYRAIRQFLNGTEAQNILTVKGGTIEGTNKSIWMQDPSANANTGSLSVAANAKLNGDVYLFVTAGSTEWPVSVSIAAAALQGESKVMTGNVPAGYDVAEVNGAYGVYTGVAKIGTAYYETLKAAVEAAQAGETITLIDNVEASEVILLGKSLTIDGNGYKVTSNATRVFRATTSNTEITLNGVNMVNTAERVGTNDIRGISVDDVTGVKLTLNNCSVDFTDPSANDWTYAVNVVGGSGHVVTVNDGAYEGANVINVRGANQTVIVKDAVLTSLYPNNDTYYGSCIYVVQNANSSVKATGNTFNGDNAFAFNVGYTPIEESDNIDNTKYVVAMIGDAYYTSIQAAVEAAQNDETIKLTQNVKMDTKGAMANCDGYPTFVLVEGKSVTIDLNGKNITANAYAEDITASLLLGVFATDNGGKLTLMDSKGTATVTLNANDAKVYSVLCNYEEGCQIKVEGGTYVADKLSDSMIYSGVDAGENEGVTVNGGNFTLGNLGQDPNPDNAANGKPWIFNTLYGNLRNVVVNGGTFNADVNHQFWANEVFVPETKALKANENGTWTVVPAVAYTEELATSTSAYSRKIGYATFEDAFAATNKYNCKNNTVVVVKDVAVENTITVAKDVNAVLDLNGKTISQEKACTASYEMIKNLGNLTITDGTEAKAGKISFKDTGAGDPNFGWGSYTVRNEGTLTVENGTIEHLGEQSFATHCIMAIFQYSGSTTINGGTISTPNYRSVRLWKGEMTINGGTFDGQIWAQAVDNTAKLTINGGTFEPNGNDASSVFVTNDKYDVQFAVTDGTFNGKVGCTVASKLTEAISGGTFSEKAKNGTNEELIAAGFTWGNANADGTYNVVVNPEYGKIAQIGNGGLFENQYFATLNDAAQAAKTGDVIKLIADVNISAAGYATVDEENQYSTMMAVKEKDITLDMNGKTITVTPTADEVADAEMQMLMSVFGMDTNGKLTITGNGTVKVVANGTQVYSIVTAYGEGSQVTIENGNFEADKLMISGSLFYSQQSECIIVNGGNFKLGNLADPEGQNGQPWIFNTKGQNYTGAIVNGGTFPTDINHQFWAHEVRVPETKALKANEDGTWTVVDAVAYTTEKASSRGSYFRNIGYASIEDAIAATDKYNCQNNTVTLIKDIAIEKMITVTNGTTVVLDLAGKTITGTDNATASFGLITNKGDLTITDSSEEAAGKITLTATQNRGWSAYSSVISNQVGGKLTVDAGTIEHLGGTSMAWGIDNLTNGKGTYAETIINGGVVKSAYIAIRQFLNGVEAQNILTVNGGTLQGGTASLYFQDPSKNANTGTLDVFEDATLAGDVYLDVTEGSTEWPVEVYITKAALGEYLIHTENIPEDAAALVEYAEFWQVEQKNLAELTIDDAEYSEYINKIVKNVAVLTYERSFDDTEWQTLYLPFEVPVENLLADFEVAYIYNAGYKNNVATIDYVVIDENSAVTVLAANYPYLIRAKEAGNKSIVVENAKLMPTVVNTIDCSSVFEKFVFAGNYSTLDASTLDAKKGYFDMNSGNWSRMDVLNPFRVYMQIEVRNGDGSDFVYPTDSQSIRMRSVDVNGNGTTGINGVDAEQNADYIFDLQGRRVLEPQKGGIYIVNGKKVIF